MPRLLSPFPAAFPFFPWQFALAHTQATLLAVAPQQSLAGSLLQHRFKPKLSIFTFEKLYKHWNKSACYGWNFSKEGEKNTHYLLGKGIKRRQHINRDLQKTRNILKVNATAFKSLTFLQAKHFWFCTQKQQLKRLHSIHISVTWSSHFPNQSFLYKTSQQ